MPGGRPRKSTEGVDEKTIKARKKATDYAEKKRLEMEALQLEIIDCRDDMARMKKKMTEIKKDIKKYEAKQMSPFVFEELDLPKPKPLSKAKPAKSASLDIEPPPPPIAKKIKQLKPLPPKINKNISL